jgi:hypothetical protein
MSRTIQVRYDDVRNTNARHRSILQTGLETADAKHVRTQSLFDGIDSATNTALNEDAEKNLLKGGRVEKTMSKLISFTENSTRDVEAEEVRVGSIFSAYLSVIGGKN